MLLQSRRGMIAGLIAGRPGSHRGRRRTYNRIHSYPCRSEAAGDRSVPVASIVDVPPPSRASPAPTGSVDGHRTGFHSCLLQECGCWRSQCPVASIVEVPPPSRARPAPVRFSPAAPLPLHGRGAAARGCWSGAGAWRPVPHRNPGARWRRRSLRAHGSGGSCNAAGRREPTAPS